MALNKGRLTHSLNTINSHNAAKAGLSFSTLFTSVHFPTFVISQFLNSSITLGMIIAACLCVHGI